MHYLKKECGKPGMQLLLHLIWYIWMMSCVKRPSLLKPLLNFASCRLQDVARTRCSHSALCYNSVIKSFLKPIFFSSKYFFYEQIFLPYQLLSSLEDEGKNQILTHKNWLSSKFLGFSSLWLLSSCSDRKKGSGSWYKYILEKSWL